MQATQEVRDALSGTGISIEGSGSGGGGPAPHGEHWFIATIAADGQEAALESLRGALQPWGDVPIDDGAPPL
jgi:hypothetical protein